MPDSPSRSDERASEVERYWAAAHKWLAHACNFGEDMLCPEQTDSAAAVSYQDAAISTRDGIDRLRDELMQRREELERWAHFLARAGFPYNWTTGEAIPKSLATALAYAWWDFENEGIPRLERDNSMDDYLSTIELEAIVVDDEEYDRL